jgi:hypothetical protein
MSLEVSILLCYSHDYMTPNSRLLLQEKSNGMFKLISKENKTFEVSEASIKMSGLLATAKEQVCMCAFRTSLCV